jgi:uncharacterized membrane protein HdeD (DUF308 family)
MGILSAIAGIIVLAFPGLTLLGLAVIRGVWLVVFGVMVIMAALRLRAPWRTLRRAAAQHQTAPAIAAH